MTKVSTKPPVKLVTIEKLYKLCSKIFVVFGFTLVLWLISVAVYAVVIELHLEGFRSIVTAALTWMFIIFVVVTILSVYFMRILHDSLVPLILKILRETDEAPGTAESANASAENFVSESEKISL